MFSEYFNPKPRKSETLIHDDLLKLTDLYTKQKKLKYRIFHEGGHGE